MITSKQIIETFVGSGIAYGETINIYENPSSSDFLSLSKEAKSNNRKLEDIRFIVNAKKQVVYVADAEICTHEDIRRIMSLPLMWNRIIDYWLIDGLARKTGGGAKIRHCTLFVENFQHNWNWSFASKYISGFSEYLDNFKRKYIRK